MDPNISQSPTPIMSCLDINLSTTSDVSSEASTGLGHRRSTIRTRNNYSSPDEQSILPSSVSQPSPSSYQPTHDRPTLDPANQSELLSKFHYLPSLNDVLDSLDSNSSSLSRFIRECHNIPPSFPSRSKQTVGLTSSSVSRTEISTSLSTVHDSSRFSPPASGPSPRRYQKDLTTHRRYQIPTAANFLSSRLPRRQSPSSSPPVVQSDVNDILFYSDISNNESSNEIQPAIDNDNLSFPNQDDNYTQSQPTSSPTSSDLSLKKDAFKRKWAPAFSSDIPWSEFCSLCDEFAVETRLLALEIAADFSPTSNRRKPFPRCNRPTGRRPAFRHRPLLLNPAEAQRIQTLYRHSKKKAVRKILSPNCPLYSG